MTNIERFITENKDWESKLSSYPYNLNIRKSGALVLFKYSCDSIMSEAICQEARGIILHIDNNNVRVVCHGFDKFFNYSEENAAEIDWSTACILEKVDGTNIRLFYYEGEWHIATLGCINAHEANVGEGYTSFGDLFLRALNKYNYSWMRFTEEADKDYTYIFELVSPESRIVIPYALGLYYLGRRNMITGEEDNALTKIWERIPVPKTYHMSNLNDCVFAAANLSRDEEGYVVNDANLNRIKIKGAEYLALHYLRGNGSPTLKNLISMRRDGTLDDYTAFCEFYAEKVRDFNDTYQKISAYFNSFVNVPLSFTSKKELAFYSKDYPLVRDFLFRVFDGQFDCAEEYLNSLSEGQLVKIFENYTA